MRQRRVPRYSGIVLVAIALGGAAVAAAETAAPAKAATLPPAEDAAKARLDASPRHGEMVGVDVAGKAVRVWVVYPERHDKAPMVAVAKKLIAMGFKILATRGTADVLNAAGATSASINKVLEGRPHIVDAMKSGDVHLVFNTTEGALAIADSASIRQTALAGDMPYYTTVAGARAAVEAIAALQAGALEVAPLQSYFSASF